MTERRSLVRERLSINAISNDDLNTFLENGASQETKLGFLDGVKSAALGSGDDAFFAARMAGDVIASPLGEFPLRVGLFFRDAPALRPSRPGSLVAGLTPSQRPLGSRSISSGCTQKV
ncbi:hypothetical protein D187_002387 [Cystobacter fuscus DSM 2262]|uniref:Uncharacterized protein n=1 Tax=Cystobacter fuscus (strain ATCC 25194 / DSM 2262 / NBRC 100088 / M29) TaxID=1242864 RepID=S9PB10_CYSF2|nr:hypothetical protein [Cystobacter fuscus]EPX60301.1 hypothetical protein D187_002387 [Cystobacter fuscus DSM 2262]